MMLKRKFYIDDKPVFIDTEQEKQDALEILESKILAAKMSADESKLNYYNRLLIKLKDII